MEKSERALAIIVLDLGFGDAGKGSVVDALVRKYAAHTVLRYNGGAQAAHTVITPDGRTHTFAQFGSGTFVPGVCTYLSRFMLVDPFALINEEQHLREVGVTDALERLSVDTQALVVTPFARAVNRLKEATRGDARHGSCGMGIGETVFAAKNNADDALVMGDLVEGTLVRKKLRAQQAEMRVAAQRISSATLGESEILREEWNLLHNPDMPEILAQKYLSIAKKFHIVDQDWARQLCALPGVIIFEGAQGVLLDETYGFPPYHTWSDTTAENANALLDECHFTGTRICLGVLRAYGVRHGPGPFPTESDALMTMPPEYHNGFNEWQREFRLGWFDTVLTRYAIQVSGGIDALAITNVDRLEALAEWKIATSYMLGENKFRNLAAPRGSDEFHQEALTDFLRAALPQYETLSISSDDFAHPEQCFAHPLIRKIEEELSVPITLLSFGTSSVEKYFRV